MIRLYFLLGSLSFCLNAFGQITNPDSLFHSAQMKAHNGAYSDAIANLILLHKIYPENSDYTIFLTRVYIWNNQIIEASNLIENEWEKGNKTEETLRLYLQVLIIMKNGVKTSELSTEGINQYPKEQDYYRLQKGIALEMQGKDIDALQIISEIPNESEHNNSAQYLKTQILQKQKKEISFGYLNTSFSNPGASPWHFLYVQYKYNFENNTIIGRINQGYMFSKYATQFEIDLYPKINNNNYFYLNTSLSLGQSIFPSFRLGAEFYREQNQWSGSFGVRYLYFNVAQVTMITGHIGNYFDDWFVAYRPFAVSVSNEWFLSHGINFKKTFESKESFVQLDLQYGVVPYYYYYFTSNEFKGTSSYKIGINYKFRISNNIFVQPIVMYEWEEYFPDSFRNRFNAQLNVFLRFR